MGGSACCTSSRPRPAGTDRHRGCRLRPTDCSREIARPVGPRGATPGMPHAPSRIGMVRTPSEIAEEKTMPEVARVAREVRPLERETTVVTPPPAFMEPEGGALSEHEAALLSPARVVIPPAVLAQQGLRPRHVAGLLADPTPWRRGARLPPRHAGDPEPARPTAGRPEALGPPRRSVGAARRCGAAATAKNGPGSREARERPTRGSTRRSVLRAGKEYLLILRGLFVRALLGPLGHVYLKERDPAALRSRPARLRGGDGARSKART